MEPVSTHTAMGMAEEINRQVSNVGFRSKREYICTENVPEGEMSWQENSRYTKTRKGNSGFG